MNASLYFVQVHGPKVFSDAGKQPSIMIVMHLSYYQNSFIYFKGKYFWCLAKSMYLA